eukprot:TRINITY_DN7937_c0_g1_i4.p2 TRINITY_DN7937_c0_g1~~TRINITY_DN7937_c0_g1_i4.p2  ORF type:complete len:191 (-),score=29.12 TRINITY_DN7937_c0_g1_i4:129-701(-)
MRRAGLRRASTIGADGSGAARGWSARGDVDTHQRDQRRPPSSRALRLEAARAGLALMQRLGVRASDRTFGALAHGLRLESASRQIEARQLGELEREYRALQQDWGLVPDAHTFNIRLDAHSKAGDRSGVLRVWAEMGERGVVPHRSCWHTRIGAAASRGEAVELAAAMAAAGVAADRTTALLLRRSRRLA